MTIEAELNQDIDEFFDDVDAIHKGAFIRLLEQANRSKRAGGLMPVDTGALQDSLGVNGHVGKDNWINGVHATPKLGPMRATWDAFYGIFVEEGTVKQRAQPFLRTALATWDAKVSDEIRKRQ